MKKILFILLSLNLFANELQWVDEQIEAIKPPRSGIDHKSVEQLSDPFLFLKKVKEDTKGTNLNTAKSSNLTRAKSYASGSNTISKKETSFSLDAIINNSALINGKWYKLNTKVGRYTLTSIDKTSVVLSNKFKNILLTTDNKSRKLKFKNN